MAAGLQTRPPALLPYRGHRRPNLSIDKSAVEIVDLQARLTDIYQARRDKTLYISGGGSMRYGDIMTVIDAATGAGVERVGVIDEGMKRAAGGA